MKAALAAQAPMLILVIGLSSTQYTMLVYRSSASEKSPDFLMFFFLCVCVCRFLLMTVPAIRESLALKQKAAEEKIKTIDVSFIFSVICFIPPPPPLFFLFFLFSLSQIIVLNFKDDVL